MRVVAVDWSGAATGAAKHIWAAHVVDGTLTELRGGRDRAQVIADLCSLRGHSPEGLAVGLDFAFSMPAWFLGDRGYEDVGALWSAVASAGESWLAECQSPFWGRPGRRRPELPEHFRAAERHIAVGGIGPKSVFQIGGAGAVGTGSLRGMPYLATLRRAGFSIWPLDRPSRWSVVEIYPRLLTGPLHKRNRDDRVAYLEHSAWPELAHHACIESEDAFDAVISALVMDRHRDHLRHLGQTSDPITRLEGEVWRPPTI
jgi:hypothetical protein